MRSSGLGVVISMILLLTQALPSQAVEEGQFVKKDGKWEYYSGEDPGLKYLYLKGLITEEEYNKGSKVLETRERLTKPNFTVDVNNGLNFRVGEKFQLKLRLLAQVRYTHSMYNEAWGTIGDSRNPEILGGQVEYRAFRYLSDSNTFSAPRVQLQFLGHAFDPDFRYNVSVALNQTPWDQEGGSGFASNLQGSRDVGISIASDEDKYKFNYAVGIWGGVGANLTREGTSVSQNVLPQTGTPGAPNSGTTRTYNYDTRFLTGEMMYTVRLLYKIAGNPGYGQGDILNSRTPQAAIAFGYAYDPAHNYLSSI